MTPNLTAPKEWTEHWSAMPNSVRALYAEISPPFLPFAKRWWRIEAWGQLCFDDAAAQATAFNMYNRLPNHGNGWRFHRWKCEMDGPCEGPRAKLSGDAPAEFDIYNYVSSAGHPFGKLGPHFKNESP